MRSLILAVALFASFATLAQKPRLPAKNYPSLLWEITGRGLNKPSYLFGTMHVSSKMVFHLSDSFYLGIRNADVVALETNMGTWQEDFSRYDMDMESLARRYGSRNGSPTDFMNIGTLRYPSYDKKIELALYSRPGIINNFLYRSNSDQSSDFEEDTYLDMHIYQTGKKWGKKVCGVEDFDRSMQLMKEAYLDAAKDKEKKERRSYDDDEFSYNNLEDAYRSGNLDLLDTINKVNSNSAAFDEKFVYLRNSIQANSIDSILRTKASLFVGVGAAHLPGQRGVIELLRRKGYTLRPVKMGERDSHRKDEVEKIRVPVTFSKQTAADGFFSVNMPGKLYDFSRSVMGSDQQQFADMSNGSYYMVSRINTNALLWGHSEDAVLHRIDSLIYENVPGKILTRQSITRNGYKGIEIVNRTRRGDMQRYNIFVTPFEIILFKMSGTGDYVKDGPEADQFFNSIELKPFTSNWSRWSPAYGGFAVELPHAPVVLHDDNWQYMAQDRATGTGFEVLRTDVHNYDFAEEDSFDLDLMEESFASSEFVDHQVSRRQGLENGRSVLDAKYQYKDGSVAAVRFLIQGPHYYTLVAHAKSENPKMQQFIRSFQLTPYVYGPVFKQVDTSLYFTVNSPVPVEPGKKISIMPDMSDRLALMDDDDALVENTTYRERLVTSDSTGEKIYVSFSKPSRYHFDRDTAEASADTTHFKTDKENWIYRQRKIYTQPNKMKVFEYVLGDPKSSRYVHGKLFSKDGVDVRLETEGDTLMQPSAFITSFYESFQPADTVTGVDVKKKKTALFFSDFFSSDTLLHKRAVKNVSRVWFDSTDFGQLKKAISSLNWKEKKYIDTKKNIITELGWIKTGASVDYLSSLYYAAGDTVEIQYTVLTALLRQQTAASYGAFRNIMVNDPPVLDYSSDEEVTPNWNNMTLNMFQRSGSFDVTSGSGGGSFMTMLSDSVKLTGTIFKDLLPLINIHDYEQPLMNLTGMLVDSSIITANDYESYQTKFLIEAKQQLKKQIIKEKNASIQKAQADDADKSDDEAGGPDQGNEQLNLYATLLMPFWDRNPAVPQLMNQLLASNDKSVKYKTALLLLQYNKPLPDTLLNYLAGLDDYRYSLYTELAQRKKASLFPAAQSNGAVLAKSKLLGALNSYQVPDSIVYIDKLPLQVRERSGVVYFFKYKEKKADNSWKIATVGLAQADGKRFDFVDKEKNMEDVELFDFTGLSDEKLKKDEPVKDQLKKQLKKLQYSKRNSAEHFYTSERSHSFLDGLNFRD